MTRKQEQALTEGSHWYKYGFPSSLSHPAINKETPNGRTPLHMVEVGVKMVIKKIITIIMNLMQSAETKKKSDQMKSMGRKASYQQ